MLDPINALSLAANVFQFIDLGVKVVSKGKQIYRSQAGLTLNFLDLQIIAEDVSIVAGYIDRSLQVVSQVGGLSAEDQALESLSRECLAAARELKGTLDTFKLEPATTARKWKSVRQALKSVWHKEKVDAMAERLRGFREQLDSGILVSLRYLPCGHVFLDIVSSLFLFRQNIDLLAIRQSARFDLLGQMTQNIVRILLDNHESITKKLQAQSDAINNLTIRTYKFDQQAVSHPDIVISAEPTTAKRNLVAQVAQEHLDVEPVEYVAVGSTKLHLDPAGRQAERQDAIKAKFEAAIVDRLYFSHMTERQDEVADAHEQTFSWIFTDHPSKGKSWDNFATWLAESDNLYWINGKAGSGKSTLMKYLKDKDRTNELLLKWSNGLPLVTARFFAWNAGEHLQRSQEGLLRSLLYECLSQCGALTAIAFPQLWQIWKDNYAIDVKPILPKPFPLKLLKEAVLFLVNQDSFKVKFCFFVDGLDEYEGNHNVIAQLFHDVALSSSCKACVSSRPLVVFEHAFRGYPTLTLQELTYDDIKGYVRTQFEENRSVSFIRRDEPERINDLEESIVARASGVFLWVKLVVESLLEGLQNYDRASDLQRRLEALPTDLETLYLHMFQSLDPLYLEQASRLFQIMTTAPSGLSPLSLALADEEDPNYVFKATVCLESVVELDQRSRNVAGRLKSRCKGLLEIQGAKPSRIPYTGAKMTSVYSEARVEWLHKTVPDYLKRPEIEDLVESRSGADFSPEIALLKSSILEVKVSPLQPREFRDVVRNGFTYASLAEYSQGVAHSALLDEFFVAIVGKWDILPNKPSGTWSSYVESWIGAVDSKAAFFILCVMHGLFHYVKHQLDQDDSLIKHDFGLSLLRFAVLPSPMTLFDWRRSPRLVRLLLDRGADVNVRDDESTPWEATVGCVYHDLRRSFNYARWPLSGAERMIAEQWCDIVEAFVKHGADPNAKQVSGNWGVIDEYDSSKARISFPLWVIKETFSKWIPERGLELEMLLKQMAAGNSRHGYLAIPSPESDKPRKRKSLTTGLRKLFSRSASSSSNITSPVSPMSPSSDSVTTATPQASINSSKSTFSFSLIALDSTLTTAH
jgi:hypothetical protein